MDVGQQLGELGPLLTGVVGNIDESQLDNATPCTDFKVRDVLEHMIGGATMFTAAFKGDPASAPEPDLSDPINGFPPVLGGLAESILAPGALDQTVESPFGPLPGDVFARVVVLDGLVHGWDMATATGQRYEPSDELVAAAHGFAEQVLPMTAGSGAFADPVEPPADASPIERLAALTGRTV